ncbi:MAG TPA: FHA domain-containing protein [Tissierellaceae bacterium]|nr:FHA domain-containing protein [Tissierellaceae bacterium]
MYNLLAIFLKYIFIVIIYLFIFSIIRMIYLDISGMEGITLEDESYLRLINSRESLSFKINEHYIIDKEINLGRHRDNDIVVKDPFVSKRHFKIIEDEEEYFLEDLNSANGTFLNRDKISDVVRLQSRDIIKAGKIEFLFIRKNR